ncbi:MAG TPA: hypothetical protein VFM00_07210 [Candidatus Eisenbacteria bacterium]|nr:hypothetical protein [Candidatus Eisenbacteria bacterium]
MTCSRIPSDSRVPPGRTVAAAWMLAAVVALFAAPSALSAGAEPPQGGWAVIAQADTSGNPNGTQGDEGDEEEDNGVKIPPNLLEPEPGTVPDTTGAPGQNVLPMSPAPSDSGRAIVPVNPALPETIRYVQPTDPAVKGKAPAPNLVPVQPKRKGGIFGLGPAVVILSLAVVHFFVVKAVK